MGSTLLVLSEKSSVLHSAARSEGVIRFCFPDLPCDFQEGIYVDGPNMRFFIEGFGEVLRFAST